MDDDDDGEAVKKKSSKKKKGDEDEEERGEEGASRRLSERSCEWATARLRLQASALKTNNVTWHVDLKTVRNPLAAGGTHGVPGRVGATKSRTGAGGADPISPADAVATPRAAADDDDDATLRAGAKSNDATHSNYSVASFERTVVETNDALLGCDAGWT